jgi:hypothetical protein
MVTADADTQRVIAGIVSLMTGEPVSLDLGDAPTVGHATVRVPVYANPSRAHEEGTTIYTGPAPIARPALNSVSPPAPAGTKSWFRPRVVVEPGSTEPKTVLEEVIEEVLPEEPAPDAAPKR